MTTFGRRLSTAMQERGPLCAGIDPHPTLLQQWGLHDDLDGLERFALAAAEALAPVCAAVKPQSAFFERFGSRGIAVLERTVATCREAGAEVILDVKRGDIGSTAQGYADAYLRPGAPMGVDAITASPYLGFGSLQPMFDTAVAHDAGVFVLALTSNPEGARVQRAHTSTGTVAGEVLAGLKLLNSDVGALGSFGAVVGATLAENDEDLDIGGPLLVPGIGAQGGTAADVRRIFATVLDAVLPSSSRQILGAGPDPARLRDAARRTAEEFAAVVRR